MSSKEDCSICLEPFVQPCKLPCGHIFCFLCIKGTFTNSPRCGLCRQDIPAQFLLNPNLVEIKKEDLNEKSAYSSPSNELIWYYRGHNGWWQYDQRTNQIIEKNFIDKVKKFQIQIAGQMYSIDFTNMQQVRTDNEKLKRGIKRDFANNVEFVKGVAGVRLDKSK